MSKLFQSLSIGLLLISTLACGQNKNKDYLITIPLGMGKSKRCFLTIRLSIRIISLLWLRQAGSIQRFSIG